jgi:hypothetical protein
MWPPMMYISSGRVVPTFVQYTSWRSPGVVGSQLIARIRGRLRERIGVHAGASAIAANASATRSLCAARRRRAPRRDGRAVQRCAAADRPRQGPADSRT